MEPDPIGNPSSCDETERDPEEREDLRERSAHDPTGRESDEQDQEDPVQPSDTMEDFQES